jgi:hypothetical protein
VKKYNIIVLIIFAVSSLIAQPPSDGVSDEVQVLSSFNAKLQASNKLRTTPTVITDNKNSNELLTYSLPTRLLTLDYEPPVIRPLSMRKEPAMPVFNFFGKVGYGTPNSPYVDLRYNAGRGDKMDYGIRAKHHSANNNSNLANQRFSETGIGVNGTYYTSGLGIRGNIGYDLNDYYFYGDTLTSTDTTGTAIDTMRQRFNIVRAGVELFNAQATAGDVSYKAGLDFYSLTDGYDGSDVGIKAKASLTKWFDKNALTVEVYNDYNRFNLDTASANNNILAVKPSFTYHGDGFQVKAGANLGMDSSFYVFPDIEASYTLSGGKFTIIAGWTGEVVKNSYLSTTEFNPFVFSPLELRNTRVQKQYGGVKVLLNGINVTATVGNKPVKNLQLYLNDTLNQGFFHTRYASGNIFNIHGEAVLNLIENLEISGTVDFNTYNLDEARAWHLPNFESNITAIYKALEDKLKLKAEVYLMNSIPYLDAAGDEQVLTGVTDISLGATYDVTKNIGIFLDLNNITNTSNTRFFRYPNFGFNVLVGVKARF